MSLSNTFSILRKVKSRLITIVFGLVFSPFAFAHLMVAQHGTINIIEKGAFMVISVPISAFNTIDDNKDGQLSSTELNKHRSAILKKIEQNIVLSDETGILPLKDVLLSPVMPGHAHQDEHHSHEHHQEDLAKQLVIMGRFELVNLNSLMKFSINLFGEHKHEQSYEVSVRHPKFKEKQKFVLTPETPTVSLVH